MSTRQRDWLHNFNCFFVTTTFKDWLKLFINDTYYRVVGDSIKFCLRKYDALLIAYVLMPTHIHLVIFFNDKMDISGFMRDLKKYTSFRIRELLEKEDRVNLLKEIEYHKHSQKHKIWMDRFDCVLIKSARVLFTKIKYIHSNPYRKELVAREEDWIYSSSGYYKTEIEGFLPVTHAGKII